MFEDMETSRRRITVSKNGIAEHSVETQVEDLRKQFLRFLHSPTLILDSAGNSSYPVRGCAQFFPLSRC